MKEVIIDVFGEGKDLEWWHMVARGFVMFLMALVIIRVGGLRIFGKKSSFDEIVSVMLGAVLSRGITGAVPFFSAVAAGAMLVVTHRLIALLCIANKPVERLVKGKEMLLYDRGKLLTWNLLKCSLTEMDLMESLRLSTNKETLESVERAYMENNGSISFILKEKSKQ